MLGVRTPLSTAASALPPLEGALHTLGVRRPLREDPMLSPDGSAGPPSAGWVSVLLRGFVELREAVEDPSPVEAAAS